MRFSAAFFAVVCSAAAAAQQTYTILVGSNGTATFNPPYVNATSGDKIAFQFVGGNHTVTQSAFNMPCENNTSPMTGMDSGFQPVATNASMYPQYSLTMTNSNTMWFYCRQIGHCEKGMVFAINPTEQMTFQAFQNTAKASGSSLSSSATMSGAMPVSASTTNGAVLHGVSSAFVTLFLGASLIILA
ncbi:hypothetical protein CONPUDRAFT_162242 [Coniophora puteana RWD-64-598 SS2]|uniref:Cupredoxin n=1 Tax=Coniophora puteana (strain RWD-64-598) TaxID=741705 RepID=A0A5M3N0X1_CONPW|nr:uncharacterized protein CONPUDRAFT_162242 [Coniophora puteana RWD-64-598 SS2]EIW84926.1 hypothetical protein CONPUDRAFT_162242 [Coniophora puteana RWD-64-598 SS2]